MKNAEDWLELKWPYDDTKAFRENIKAIQLDAWKQGMTDAAEIVVRYAVDLGRTPVNGVCYLIADERGSNDEVRKTYKQHILRDRDNAKTV